MITTLLVIQIILSVTLIAAILMQTSGAGLGGALGGSNDDSVHHTRRGLEKYLFNVTIVVSILFVIISFVIFLLSK